MTVTPTPEFWTDYDSEIAEHGSQRKAARNLGVARTTIQEWLKNRVEGASLPQADLPLFTVMRKDVPVVITATNKVQRFIFSAAQDQSIPHGPFLTNLEAYAQHLGAEIHIAGFTYGKSLFEDHAAVSGRFHEKLKPYLTHRHFIMNDAISFCGEMNTLPTAVTPLSGFETYTRHRSGIFPHAKVQLHSVPTMKTDPAKMIMTTGVVTMPNYIPKRAGIVASFHHVIGALLVEIDEDGDWFARHLIAESDGSFQDLDTYVTCGHVKKKKCRVAAINWGDLHHPRSDGEVIDAAWGIGWSQDETMIDVLKPHYQFIHDSTDFMERSHHSMRDPHKRFELWRNGTENVRESITDLGEFLSLIQRSWCESIIVESNHDIHFRRWLRETDWRTDPVNAELNLEGNLAILQSIKEGRQEDLRLLQWAMEREGVPLNHTRWLAEDESMRICETPDDTGIECGMHGHLGANGAKAHARQFAKMGPKANVGHTHSAAILDGIYTAGTSSLLDLGYNRGLSSWSHSHIVTYPSGKRTIVRMIDGKWRAEG